MSDRTVCTVELHLEGDRGGDQEELDELTLQLRERLLELDVERVELSRSGTAPEGSKAGDVVSLGALTVTVAPFVLRSVVGLVERWIEHRPVRTVSITIGDDSLDLQVVSAVDQRRLIDTFVSGNESPTTATRSEARQTSGSGSDKST